MKERFNRVPTGARSVPETIALPTASTMPIDEVEAAVRAAGQQALKLISYKISHPGLASRTVLKVEGLGWLMAVSGENQPPLAEHQ